MRGSRTWKAREERKTTTVARPSIFERDDRLAAIGSMTSAIVHDLVNPLTAIQGYAEYAAESARRGADASEIGECLNGILVKCSRLKSLLKEVLDFARDGSVALNASPTPVASFLAATLAPLRDELARRGVELVTYVEVDSGLEVRFDRDRMERVLENLIVNAREALAASPPPSGRPTVWVRVACADGALAIRVADNGPGIPFDLGPRLFEPFATAGKRWGTGLGLATALSTMRAHGGDLTAEARGPEGGAAFTVLLPCRGDLRMAATAAAAGASVGVASPARVPGLAGPARALFEAA